MESRMRLRGAGTVRGREAKEIARLRPASYSTTDGQGVYVSGGHHGLAFTPCAVLAGIEHLWTQVFVLRR